MKLYMGLVATVFAFNGLSLSAAGVAESKETKAPAVDVHLCQTKQGLVPLFKKWMSKPYHDVIASCERGEAVYIDEAVLALFTQHSKGRIFILGATAPKDYDGVCYDVETTPYATCDYRGESCYIKMLTAPDGTVRIAVPKNSMVHELYEWSPTVDLAHLAVLSSSAEHAKLLQTIDTVVGSSLCTWPRYEDASGKTVTLMANFGDAEGYLFKARGERTTFKSLPPYLQRMVLNNYPLLKESGPIDLPNVLAIVNAKVSRIRKKSAVAGRAAAAASSLLSSSASASSSSDAACS